MYRWVGRIIVVALQFGLEARKSLNNKRSKNSQTHLSEKQHVHAGRRGPSKHVNAMSPVKHCVRNHQAHRRILLLINVHLLHLWPASPLLIKRQKFKDTQHRLIIFLDFFFPSKNPQLKYGWPLSSNLIVCDYMSSFHQ